MTSETWTTKDQTWRRQLLRVAVPNATATNIANWADTSWDYLPETVRAYIRSWEGQHDVLDWYKAAAEFRNNGRAM